MTDYSNMSQEQLKEIAEQKMNELWSKLGYSGKPTMICIHCHIPCEMDEENDYVHCTKCGLEWTFESMKKDCERMLGLDNIKK